MKTTFNNINGYDVEIQTYKGNNGVLVCNAQFGKSQERNGYSTFSFAMHQDPNITLAKSAPGTRATDKAIQTIHAAGLAKFEQMRAAGELPILNPGGKTIQPGTILHSYGYAMNEEPNLVVYETDGKIHKSINLETLELRIHSDIRHISKKFGIGTYFTDEVFPIEPILEAVERAKEKAAQDNQVKEEKAIAENRYFIPTAGAEPETTTPQDLPSFGDIQVIDYSEKAIAVTGNTKPIKDELKALGGRFNFRLSCGVGWIFPKTKSAEVCALLEKLGALEPQTALDKALESVFTA